MIGFLSFCNHMWYKFHMINNSRILFFIIVLVFLISCARQDVVKEHFQTHGMSYPLDTAGVTLFEVEYAGIEEKELLEPGAREYVEEGIMSVKEYFKRQDIQGYLPGARAIVISKPVLFRDESGDVGLMVKVTAYGQDKPKDKTGLQIEWVGSDKQIWRAENFAYFYRDDYQNWQYKGSIY